jgi:Xaa-Pro aminopeptidase
MDDTILLEARATKSPDEIERIRQMGVRTTTVVGKTARFLQSHPVGENETLIKADGSPLTIGDVKSQIKLWLAEAGAEDTEGMIFAIGRDAGVPHSSGNPDDPITLGRTIVFDIFPAEAGGGYFYDFTRTWCLGYAPAEVEKVYNDVVKVYDTVVGELKLGVNAAEYQARTCELYEAMGYETIRQNPRLEQGYIHSLGHGLGLNVHEKPWFARKEDPSNVLQVGSVFTIEPGLYYPEKGFGIRVEDTWYVKEDGSFEKLVDFPRDLVLPMKG